MSEPQRANDDEEKAGREKDRWDESRDQWWRSDRADAIGLALGFIWGALVLLADNTGFGSSFSWWDPWSVFFVGAGVIALGIALARLATTELRQKAFGGLIFGLLLIGIGVGDIVVWFWPLVLLIIGLLIFKGVLADRGHR